MKAIRFDHHGEPIEVLAIEERPAPEPVDGEVRLRILASPVNPSDLLYVRGHYAGAIDPVVGETGTQMFKALHEEGRMLVYGSLTGEPIRMGEDPRYILAGNRILKVFWLGYWLRRFDETARLQLVQDTVALCMRAFSRPHPGVNIRSMKLAPPSHEQNQWAGMERTPRSRAPGCETMTHVELLGRGAEELMSTLHATAFGRTTFSDVEGCYVHSPTITEGLKYLFRKRTGISLKAGNE